MSAHRFLEPKIEVTLSRGDEPANFVVSTSEVEELSPPGTALPCCRIRKEGSLGLACNAALGKVLPSPHDFGETLASALL